MNKTVSLLSLSLVLGSSLVGAPFMAVGDSAELFVTGRAGVRVDDNVYLNANPVNDVIFDFVPGIELTFGKNSQLKGSINVVDAIARYSDNSRLNTDLVSSNFSSNYDNGKLKLGFNMGFTELNQNTADIQGLTRRDVFSTSGNAEVEISQLASIGTSLSYNKENYKRAGYSDSESLTVPLDFFYKIAPKLDLSFGYQYRKYEAQIGEDSDDHYVNVGARGQFTPKLSGRATVGLGTRRLSRSGSRNLLGIQSSVSYELTPKSQLSLGISNDFGTSPQGQQQKNLAYNASVNFNLTEQWSANVGASLRRIGYDTRTDDYFEGTLGAAYVVNNAVRIACAYVYRSNNSVLAGGDFSNNVFSLAANLRY